MSRDEHDAAYRIDFTAVMAQMMLAKLSNERLSASLADTAIQIAYRMGVTPHEVLRIAAEKVGFSEQAWREQVEPQLREELSRAR